jgi:hypothetical protein
LEREGPNHEVQDWEAKTVWLWFFLGFTIFGANTLDATIDCIDGTTND